MSSFTWPVSGSGGGVPTYANFAAFPSAVTSGNGALAIALDTNIMYESNGTSWLAIAGPGFVLSIGNFGNTPNSKGLSLAADVLNMQPADGTHPGGVSITSQTLAGAKTLSNLLTLNAGVTSSYTTGDRNEAFGLGAGAALTTGTDNTFLGYNAGNLLASDSGTTGVGSEALASLTNNSSVGNTAVGYQAMTALTTSAGYNTALGYQAGAALTSGFQNTMFGYQSLNASLQAELVCAIGQGAFTNCINISNSVGVGASAGFSCTSSYVTYLGTQAGQSASGSFSTALGFQSLMSSSGLSSIGLGIFSGINSSGSNTLYIGDTTQDPTAYAINTVVVSSSNATGANWTQNQQFSGTLNLSALTPSTALTLDGSNNIVSSSTTSTELGYVHGVTSDIQTQLNAKQATGNYATSGTGDVSWSAPSGAGPVTTALVATTNSTLTSISSLTAIGTQSQNLNMGSNKIVSVTDPTAAQDAATKNYVDTVASQLQPIQAVTAATTGSNIPGTYVQVGGGIGDTFTITATTTFTVDGVTPTVGQRVLFKDQTSGQQNGVYNLTTAANVGVLGAIFTRSLDYDTVADVNAGSLVPVISGTVNTKTSWLQTATVTSVGTSGTPMVFVEWTANPSNYLLKANNLSDVTTKSTSFDNLSPMSAGGDIIYGGASGTGTRLANGSAGQVLQSNGTTLAPSWVTNTGGNPFDFFTSNVVNTDSSAITNVNTPTTFSNSPAFSVTPNFTGTYKVYVSVPFFQAFGGVLAKLNLIKTSGTGTLLSSSTVESGAGGSNLNGVAYLQATYTLTSGQVAVFDIQGTNGASGQVSLTAGASTVYMFAERVG